MPSAYALVSLEYYKSNHSGDIWITSAAVPPHNGYAMMKNAPKLPFLATADWSQLHTGSERTESSKSQFSDQELELICPYTDMNSPDSPLAVACKDYLHQEEIQPWRNASEGLMRPVYGCVSSEPDNHFVSAEKNCSSNTFLRTLGFVMSSEVFKSAAHQEFLDAMPFKTAPIYSCLDKEGAGDCLDISLSCSFCGGQLQGTLGYGFLLG